MFVFWLSCLLATSHGEHIPSAVEDVHKALITEAAVLPQELVRRDIATCAYISGNPASPLTCASGYNCVQTVQDIVAFACCNQIQCPGNWRLCADFGSPLCAAGLDAAECSSIYISILSCSSQNPYCFRYARSASLGAAETYYSYACGPSSSPTVVLALAGTTDAGGGGGGGGGAAATSQTQAQNTGTGMAGTTIGETQVPTSTAGQSPSNMTPSGSSLSLAAIIAISVVVGIIVLAIISCISCFMWKRHQRRTAEAKNPIRPENIPYVPTNPAYSAIGSWNNNVVNGPPAPPSEYPLSDFGRSNPPSYGRDSRRPSDLWSH